MTFWEASLGGGILLLAALVIVGCVRLAAWAMDDPLRRCLGFVPVLVVLWLLMTTFVYGQNN